MYMTSIWW